MKTAFRFRLVYRTLLLRRRRVSLALLALAVGATLASALLSTYSDLKQKMAGEFRRYGANLVVAPPPSTAAGSAAGAIQRERFSLAGTGATLAADALIEAALNAGGPDNITVVVTNVAT